MCALDMPSLCQYTNHKVPNYHLVEYIWSTCFDNCIQTRILNFVAENGCG